MSWHSRFPKGPAYLLGALLLLQSLPHSVAAEIPWRDVRPYFISARGVPVAQLLRDLGAHHGVAVAVSSKVDDRFFGTLANRPPAQLLDDLSRMYKLAWYFDGQMLHIYKYEELTSQIITPTTLQPGVLITHLRDSGMLHDIGCRVARIGDTPAVEATGAPACVERIERLAKRLDEQQQVHEQEQEAAQLFPLRYANATDTTYAYRNQQVLVPGVASVLREMAQQRSLQADTGKPGTAPAPPSGTMTPTFTADSRQNAILVRDRKSSIGLYADLIRQLDSKPELIEISVLIIDVNAGELSSLGVDWSASAAFGRNSISFNSDSGKAESSGISTVVANTGSFMVRLTALEQNSKARILSRPSVVTLNNVQAVLDRNITFYTKVAGYQDARLESISTGSLLRVTPRLIDEDGAKRVMLTLNIQDGRQDKPVSELEPLPQIQNSEITTQAALSVGQSLLLGGFVQDETVAGERKIPLLGDLPLLGRLFSTRTQNSRSVVRLFLIKAEPAAQTLIGGGSS